VLTTCSGTLLKVVDGGWALARCGAPRLKLGRPMPGVPLAVCMVLLLAALPPPAQ
jgi:hypothetical protein